MKTHGTARGDLNGGIPSNLRMLNRELKDYQKNENEPQPYQEEIPEPPAEISPAARKIWDIKAPDMIALKLLTKIDKYAFMRYCETYVEYIKCRDFIHEKGSTTYVYEMVPQKGLYGGMATDELGQPIFNKVLDKVVVHPEVVLFKQYSEELRRLEQEFGMTPASRSKIQIELDKDEKERIANTNPYNRFKYSKMR